MTENTPAIKNNLPLMPSQDEFNMLQTIARNAQESGLYAGMGQQAKIFMVLLAARELGVSPMLALNGGIWNIQGKIEISARLMNGLIRRAGHSIKIVISNDTHCTLLGTRSDGDSFECKFDMEDAIKAGLAGGNVWKKYPADMLYNRCMSRLARRLFSDVIGNAYVEGEIKEAKEVEKKERELAQAEYEEIKPSIPSIKEQNMYSKAENDALIPQNRTDSIVPQNNESKISKEELDIFLMNYVNTTDTFKDNFERGMVVRWGINDFKDITETNYPLAMSWIAKNIEGQSMPRGG